MRTLASTPLRLPLRRNANPGGGPLYLAAPLRRHGSAAAATATTTTTTTVGATRPDICLAVRRDTARRRGALQRLLKRHRGHAEEEQRVREQQPPSQLFNDGRAPQASRASTRGTHTPAELDAERFVLDASVARWLPFGSNRCAHTLLSLASFSMGPGAHACDETAPTTQAGAGDHRGQHRQRGGQGHLRRNVLECPPGPGALLCGAGARGATLPRRRSSITAIRTRARHGTRRAQSASALVAHTLSEVVARGPGVLGGGAAGGDGQPRAELPAVRMARNANLEASMRLWENYGTWQQDLEWIRDGLYKYPWDMEDVRASQYRPDNVLSRSAAPGHGPAPHRHAVRGGRATWGARSARCGGLCAAQLAQVGALPGGGGGHAAAHRAQGARPQLDAQPALPTLLQILVPLPVRRVAQRTVSAPLRVDTP